VPQLKKTEGEDEPAVSIAAGARHVRGVLSLPRRPVAVVIFAHGGGSGRYSPRNRFVARRLHEAGLATLLIDLLEEDEGHDRGKIFDITLLADRLECATHWIARNPQTSDLKIGYFGASTGAAAALVAAARQPNAVGAVVSRGGRPDLAFPYLRNVIAPSLLLVGGRDKEVMELNCQALSILCSVKELIEIPGATHLFPEPGTLEKVAELAERWFVRFLARGSVIPQEAGSSTRSIREVSDLVIKEPLAIFQ
jgi:putative phosphoribosyl transferase